MPVAEQTKTVLDNDLQHTPMLVWSLTPCYAIPQDVKCAWKTSEILDFAVLQVFAAMQRPYISLIILFLELHFVRQM